MEYAWKRSEWPQFKYHLEAVEVKYREFLRRSDYLRGLGDGLSSTDQQVLIIDTMLDEAVNTNSIEGEKIPKRELKSSIINNLTPGVKTANVADLRARGIGRVLAENRRTFTVELSEAVLFDWHALLLGHDRNLKNIGYWRTGTGPMQIISGPTYAPTVHFEAPPSTQVVGMMKKFIEWFNQDIIRISNPLVGTLRSVIGHLYFETIHPFEDGNGRIGRVLLEKGLYAALGSPQYFSVSYAIEQNRQAYYDNLQRAQRTLDVTEWLDYFIDVLLHATNLGEKSVHFTLKKNTFYTKFGDQLNARQQKAITKIFNAGPGGFQGGLNIKKYVSINRTSTATATRDLTHLVHLGAFTRHGGGRSTHYLIALE